MIYMRNITITTAKSATYLENVGLNPGESVGVGWAFQGRPKNVFFAVCTVDTSKNNAVFITLEEPAFHFLPNCDYECE